MVDIHDGDIQLIHTMIANGTHFKTLNKEEICASLKATRLNLGESIYLLHQIHSTYEVLDRFDIVRNLSLEFGGIENVDLTNVLEFLSIFGKCIECDSIHSIVDIVKSAFSMIKRPQNVNKNIESLKSIRRSNPISSKCFNKIYSIFNTISDENDVEAMSFAIRKNLHYTKNDFNANVIEYSLKNNNIKLIHFLIESVEDYNHIITPHLIKQLYKEIISKIKYFAKIPHLDLNLNEALAVASSNGFCNVVKYLLTVPGIDVNAKSSFSRTALIWASFNGHHEVVKLLLTVPGIDVNVKDRDNRTPLCWASYYGHHKVVKLLLTVPELDINAKADNDKTALIIASGFGQSEIVKLLLAVPGIDVNAKDKENYTALISASRFDRSDIVKLLLTAPGLDVNAKDDKDRTALIIASIYGNHEVVKVLLTAPGIDINAKDKDNKTAEIWALKNSQKEVLAVLRPSPWKLDSAIIIC